MTQFSYTEHSLSVTMAGRSIDEVRAVELAPFAAAIAAGADLVMSAHIVFSAYDDAPATLSHRVLTGLLREELGFDHHGRAGDAGDHRDDADRGRGRRLHPGRCGPGHDRDRRGESPALTARLVDAVGNGTLDAARLADAAARVRDLAVSLAGRSRQPGLDGAPAWNPYFSGLPEVFARVASGSDGVVLRGEDGAALSEARSAAAGRPLVVAIQNAVRTPWMREALQLLLEGHDGETLVLCTGIPQDRAIVPAVVPAAVTAGRTSSYWRQSLLGSPGADPLSHADAYKALAYPRSCADSLTLNDIARAPAARLPGPLRGW